MHILVSDQTFLEQWYETWALLRDEERVAVLPNLAAGLDSILFAINIDNEAFSTDRKRSGGKCSSKDSVEKNKIEPIPQMAQLPDSHASRKLLSLNNIDHGRRRRKKVHSQLVSFDEDTLMSVTSPPPVSVGYYSAPTTSVNSPAATSSTTPYSDSLNRIVQEAELENAKEKVNKTLEQQAKYQHFCSKELSGSLNSLHEISAAQSECNLSYTQALEDLLQSQTLSLKSYSPLHSSVFEEKLCDQDSGSYKSGHSNVSDESLQISDSDSRQVGLAHLTPLFEGPGNLIPLSPDGETVFNFTATGDVQSIKSSSQDEFDVSDERLSETKDIDCKRKGPMSNSASLGSMASGASLFSSPSISKGSTVTASSFSSLTVEELKSVILEISKARDAAEERRNELVAELNCEMESSSTLQAQLIHEQTQRAEAVDRITLKVNALTRENELLRHQLKKYVGAVQMLRREGFEEESITGGELLTQPCRQPPSLRDYHDEAVAYESKLIQVAEMHGELMEFNGRLQRLLKFRESQVRHLKEELVELRGPLPNEDDDEFDETLSITSDIDTLSSPRTLINIWIPTAFLAGPSSDTHHVYQIYVRIKDDEWNVYRRFAQFYELHKHFKKKEPIVKTYDFPQKKTFGYKDISVVENRRLRLQQYLRKLVNLLVSSYANLSCEPDKSSFTAALPFLSDTLKPCDSGPLGNVGQNQRKFLSRLSSSSRSENSQSSPQYNGL